MVDFISDALKKSRERVADINKQIDRATNFNRAQNALKTLTLPAYIQQNLASQGFALTQDSSTDLLKYFYGQLYGTGNDLDSSSKDQFQPDINGFVLVFMVPPDLSGYRLYNLADDNINKIGKRERLYADFPSSWMYEVSKLATFAAVDFSPPTYQVNTDRISARTGGIPYATEVSETEQFSITFIDNHDLDIYHLHHIWLEYIRDVLHGWVNPAEEYISGPLPIIDYAASFYVIKYLPNMNEPTFAAKCVGCFPQGLPTKELIGSRTSNELTTLPFSYFVSIYREAVWMEKNHWIFDELQQKILPRFSSQTFPPKNAGFNEPDGVDTRDKRTENARSIYDDRRNKWIITT